MISGPRQLDILVIGILLLILFYEDPFFTFTLYTQAQTFIKLHGGASLESRRHVAIGIKGDLYAGMAQAFLNNLGARTLPLAGK